MKIKLLTICIIILNSLINCQKKEIVNKLEAKSMENINIKHILKKQIKAGAGSEYWELGVYGKEDLDILVSIEDTLLKNHGYKELNIEDFNNRIKMIFRRIIDNSTTTDYLKIDLENKCDKTLEYQALYTGLNFIYISKKNKFITYLLPLPSIIDYIKLYPESAKYEEKDLIIEDITGNTKIKVTQWKDIPDLSQERNNNIQTLINRNKYLFNDNKASLAWLKFNDTYFLESLVKTFGYMDDKDLLQWVIDRTLSDKNNKGEDYNSLFFMKDCSNKFVFHKETFEVLREHINNKTLEVLESYIQNRNENQELQALPFEQKAQVLAYVLYLGEYFGNQEKYSNRFMFTFMGPFYEHSGEGDTYDEEFKKNNYYNLPDFKKLWEQAKEEGDGIGLPM